MNRFAALFRFGPGLAEPDRESRAMLSDMEGRNPGLAEMSLCGSHCLMQVGTVSMPLVQTRGPLTFCGDLGLIDLPDLRALAQDVTDGDPVQCLLALWLRLEERALPYLNGVFAFALHDARDGRSWVVRDRMGVRPVVYAQAGRRIVVASDLSTVLAGLDRRPAINRQWVAEFLSGQTISDDNTAHDTVLRLPPGHLLRINARGQAVRSTWYRLEDAADPAPDDGPEALQAALRHATLQSCEQGPTATFLSGGLDSSSLALLSLQPGTVRPALSLRYDDPALDEGPYIEAVLRQSCGGLEPVNLRGEPGGNLFDLDALLAEQDQPFFAPGLIGNRHLYRVARELGCTGILDGHGGDEVISGALWNIARIAEGGHWRLALRLAYQQGRFTGDSPRDVIAQLLAWKGRRGFGRIGRAMLRQPSGDPAAWRSMVDAELARETDLVARVRAQHAAEGHLSPLQAHVSLLAQPLAGTAFEILDRAARAAGINPSYPFYDHRVVELCVWQPDAAKVADGQPRSLLRRAMRGVLPEMVRLRRDKVDFISGFWNALRRDPQRRLAAFARGPGVLEGWASPATLRQDAGRILASDAPDAQTAFRVWRAVWLAAWLERAPVSATSLVTHSGSP